MYTIIFLILCLIVFVTISVFIASKITKDDAEVFGIGILLSIIFIFIYLFTSMGFDSDKYIEQYKSYELAITSLQDNITTEGSRYCIRTQDEIYFSKLESDGLTKLGHLKSDYCKFTFDGGNKIEAFDYRWKEQYQWLKYVFPLNSLVDDTKPLSRIYIIHCPEGTVKTDFNIDLKN